MERTLIYGADQRADMERLLTCLGDAMALASREQNYAFAVGVGVSIGEELRRIISHPEVEIAGDWRDEPSIVCDTCENHFWFAHYAEQRRGDSRVCPICMDPRDEEGEARQIAAEKSHNNRPA